jgi:hypothetical protein
LEDVPAEKQSDYLSLLLTPLCQQIEAGLVQAKVASSEDFPVKIANIQFAIVAINALSKGFNERLVTASRPGIGLMFKQVCKQDGLFPLMNHVLLCNLSFNAFVLFATSVVDCNSLP